MNMLRGKPLFTLTNIVAMQLNHLQSEILLSVKKLKAEQQKDVLQFIDDLHQHNQKVRERLKQRALKEIRQALRGDVAV